MAVLIVSIPNSLARLHDAAVEAWRFVGLGDLITAVGDGGCAMFRYA